jgi:hypothetical protein
MLKLTRRLFSFSPDPHYADFHERALFNHVLASIEPESGRTSYMVPVGRGVQQEYQDMQHSFTCCVGTGMENHALHGYGIYYESPDTVWVNLFVPSEAHLANGATIKMETGFPDGDSTTMTLTMPTAKAFTLAVRRPVWAGDGFAIKVNGTVVPQPALASLRDFAAGGRANAPGNEAEQFSSYVNLARTWKSGDTIELALPKSVYLQPTPDNKRVAAVMWGPLVLAGDLAPRREARGEGRRASDIVIPTLVAADRPVSEWVTPVGTRAGDFQAKQVARVVGSDAPVSDVALAPFYRTQMRTYSVYFDVLTSSEFDARSAAATAERARVAKMQANTMGFVQPGDPQSERAANYQSDSANRPIQRDAGKTARSGTGWFSFELGVDAAKPMALIVTYFTELGIPPTAGNFQITVDGSPLPKFVPDATADGFYTQQYPLPTSLTSGKSKATVKFEADSGGRIVPIFGVRTIKLD